MANKRTIIIKKPDISFGDTRVKLTYNLSLVDESGISKSDKVWFSFSNKYKEFICTEVCDPIVIILAQYCLRGGVNIESELPMTDRLYYELNSQFIPQMLVMNPQANSFEIKADTISPNWHPNAVATAMSCGIDSLTTYYEHMGSKYPDNFKLTHLTYYEQGAQHGDDNLDWNVQDRIYKAQVEKVKSFCQSVNCELIDIESNVSVFLDNFLWHEYYAWTHTYRNMAFTLFLSKLIKVYYYASAYNLDEFVCSLNADPAHYEKWVLPVLSTDYTSFFSANSSLSRLEKIKFLSTIPETYNHVLVCFMEGYNCGVCVKCWRTMLEMDVLGVLDLYKESFDVKSFRKHKNLFITQMLYRRKTEPVMDDIYRYMISHNIVIPKECKKKAKKLELKRDISQIKLLRYTYKLMCKIIRKDKKISKSQDVIHISDRAK